MATGAVNMLLSSAAHTRLSATVIALLSVMSGSVYSIDLDAQRNALNIIADFADRICTRIPLEGSGENIELSGQAKAELNAILNRLVDLGIQGAVRYRRDEWQGLLQEDLAKMVSESTNCKRQVWEDLKFLLVTSSKNGNGRIETNIQDMLYETFKFEKWSLTPDWKRLSNGMLVNDGTGSFSDFAPIFAPYKPDSEDYAVEAEIQVIQSANASSFGVVVRADGKDGYAVGAGAGQGRHWRQKDTNICYLGGAWATNGMRDCIAEGQVFDPGTDWHTYRIEVKVNTITLFIDDAFMTEVTDNKFTLAGRVGLWSNKYQLEVRSFKVIKLKSQ
jgi:hypothetical protein